MCYVNICWKSYNTYLSISCLILNLITLKTYPAPNIGVIFTHNEWQYVTTNEGFLHERRVYTGKFTLAENNFKCVNLPVYTSAVGWNLILLWQIQVRFHIGWEYCRLVYCRLLYYYWFYLYTCQSCTQLPLFQTYFYYNNYYYYYYYYSTTITDTITTTLLLLLLTTTTTTTTKYY